MLQKNHRILRQCNNIMVNTDSRNHEFLPTNENHKMKSLIKYLTKLQKFVAQTWQQRYQSDLEQYIANRYPKNAADVESWTREYQARTMRGMI